jgi:hypothetical protein
LAKVRSQYQIHIAEDLGLEKILLERPLLKGEHFFSSNLWIMSSKPMLPLPKADGWPGMSNPYGRPPVSSPADHKDVRRLQGYVETAPAEVEVLPGP